MINLEVLCKLERNKSKCETSVEFKFIKHLYRSIDKNSNLLDLIHRCVCVCDMKSIPSRDGKKYFIIFVDDCTQYCYMYSLKNKDEAIKYLSI